LEYLDNDTKYEHYLETHTQLLQRLKTASISARLDFNPGKHQNSYH